MSDPFALDAGDIILMDGRPTRIVSKTVSRGVTAYGLDVSLAFADREPDPTIADEPEAPTDDQPEPENDPVEEPDDGAGEAPSGVEP